MRVLQLLDIHKCPFKRRSCVEAIAALHTALHELERRVFLFGPNYGKITPKRLFSFATEEPPMPLPPSLPETRHSLPLQPAANPTDRRLEPLPAVLRHHALLLKEAAKETLQGHRESEDSDSFCCGSIIDEEEIHDTKRITIRVESGKQQQQQQQQQQQKVYVLEDLQL